MLPVMTSLLQWVLKGSVCFATSGDGNKVQVHSNIRAFEPPLKLWQRTSDTLFGMGAYCPYHVIQGLWIWFWRESFTQSLSKPIRTMKIVTLKHTGISLHSWEELVKTLFRYSFLYSTSRNDCPNTDTYPNDVVKDQSALFLLQHLLIKLTTGYHINLHPFY